MSSPEDKAKEIERAVADRKDADQALNDKLDKLLEGFDGVTKRLDALESARKDASDADALESPADKDTKKAVPSRADAIKLNSELAKIQARADSVSQMFGSSAPRPMDGEKPHPYRVRMLRNFQHNSPEFKDVDLDTVAEGATFDAIEKRIYADSASAAATPLVPQGELREVRKRDASGRTISKFYGEPRSWMQQFMIEPQLVERINRES